MKEKKTKDPVTQGETVEPKAKRVSKPKIATEVTKVVRVLTPPAANEHLIKGANKSLAADVAFTTSDLQGDAPVIYTDSDSIRKVVDGLGLELTVSSPSAVWMSRLEDLNIFHLTFASMDLVPNTGYYKTDTLLKQFLFQLQTKKNFFVSGFCLAAKSVYADSEAELKLEKQVHFTFLSPLSNDEFKDAFIDMLLDHYQSLRDSELPALVRRLAKVLPTLRVYLKGAISVVWMGVANSAKTTFSLGQNGDYFLETSVAAIKCCNYRLSSPYLVSRPEIKEGQKTGEMVIQKRSHRISLFDNGIFRNYRSNEIDWNSKFGDFLLLPKTSFSMNSVSAVGPYFTF